jgi:antagonist of KipI
MSRIHVLKPGLMTTVQDLGRPGWQRYGVTPGGAVDACALRLANLLTGNPETAAALEITAGGPTLRFAEETLVAIAGADFETSVNGSRLPAWRPVRLGAGAELAIGMARVGLRCYLAVAGGLAVPRILGGRGTHLAAGFGGFEGRALRAGDVLKIGPPAAWAKRFTATLAGAEAMVPAHWEVGAAVRPKYSTAPVVKVMRGPQWEAFDAEAQARFLGERFVVDARSDRMGLRLNAAGGGLLKAPLEEIVSEGVATGAVQVPPDGQPIVLLADRQTVGGYPKIAIVASVDLPLLAQLRAGDSVTFTEIPVAEAQELWLANERLLATVKQGIALHAT